MISKFQVTVVKKTVPGRVVEFFQYIFETRPTLPWELGDFGRFVGKYESMIDRRPEATLEQPSSATGFHQTR